MNAIPIRTEIALFLDLDGTLIDIAPTPFGAAPPPGLSALVAALTATLDGALAILSGRAISAIDRLLFPLRPAAAGANGGEIRDEPGGASRLAVPLLPQDFVEAVSGLSQLDPGIAIEPKGPSIAVHYRQAESEAPELLRRLRELLTESGLPLDIRAGKKVFEIVNRNVSKGAALKAFMQRPAFRGRRPLMIGDDAVDVDAFVAAESIGGAGLRVAGEYFAEAEADFKGTAVVRDWLAALAADIESRKGERKA
jgi:trehalose 6-phosphate phosphatase